MELDFSASRELNSNADAGANLSPHVTTDGRGVWISIWQSTKSLDAMIGADPDILLSRSMDEGVKLTEPMALNTNANSDLQGDSNPRITNDEQGTWIVA